MYFVPTLYNGQATPKGEKKGVMINSQFIIKITTSVSRIFYYGNGFKDSNSIYINLNFFNGN